MSRREQLEQLLELEPNDPFLRYGLAMSCASENDFDAAEIAFRRLLSDHPDYVAGYFQFAQMKARLGDNEAARPLLQTGIAVARRVGDDHAVGEMSQFLDMLE